MVRWRDRRERALDRVRRAQVLPVLGREVVEGKQRFAILRQALYTGNLPERGVLLVIYCDN